MGQFLLSHITHYLIHLTISYISISHTSHYLIHLFISYISISHTSHYLVYFVITCISLSHASHTSHYHIHIILIHLFLTYTSLPHTPHLYIISCISLSHTSPSPHSPLHLLSFHGRLFDCYNSGQLIITYCWYIHFAIILYTIKNNISLSRVTIAPPPSSFSHSDGLPRPMAISGNFPSR